MNRLWAQLSALGVGRIMLTNAEKVERPYFDTHVLDEAHYRPLLIEGLQQAKDTRLPLVSIHRQFRVFVEDELDALSPDAVRFVADARASTPMQAAPDVRVLLAVGPEGGWNSFELNLLLGHRFTPISLGARTLRSDTACIALLTLAHAALRGR
jgi:16S rRNA (uracil1498-N3)-methyltransferase